MIAPPPAAPVPLETPEQRRRRWWIEVGVVFALAVLPDFVNALAPAPAEHQGPAVYWWAAAATTSRAFMVSAPILYIIWRSGETWSHFGLRRWRWGIDLGGTVLVIVGAGLAYRLYSLVTMPFLPIQGVEAPEYPFATPPGPLGLLALIPQHAANGFAEELAIWGFLFVRLRSLWGGAVPALLAASTLFASYHLYQGWWAAGAILAEGLVHGAFFALTGRLWPLALAHALTNIYLFATWAPNA